jgi:hypothetical protein
MSNPNGHLSSDLVLSDDYLGFASCGATVEGCAQGPEGLYVINLRAGSSSESLLAPNSTDLSISGDFGAWIGERSGLPFVGHL